MGIAWAGDVPLSLYYRLAIHVAILGSIELDASDEGHFRRCLGAVGVTWSEVSSGTCMAEKGQRRTRGLDQLAAVVGDSKTDALDDDFVNGG